MNLGFYAAVFEAERPELKSLPLAVQQKQIIVTCNYEGKEAPSTSNILVLFSPLSMQNFNIHLKLDEGVYSSFNSFLKPAEFVQKLS